MADLTFTQLAAELPNGAVFDDATNGICIKIGTLIGETVDDLSDEKVSETVYKLLLGLQKAQATANANAGNPLPAGSRYNVVGATVFAQPTVATNGSISTNASITFNTTLPVTDTDVMPRVA